LKALEPGKRMWLERGIFVYKTLAGRLSYGISYMANGRRHQEIVGPYRSMASTALDIRHGEIAQDRFNIPTRAPTVTFSAFAEIYIEHDAAKNRSHKRNAGIMRRFQTTFADKSLDELTAWDVERYRASRDGKVVKSTVNRELAVLRHALNMAVEWGHLEKNPTDGVKAYKTQQNTIRVLTPQEEDALIQASPHHIKPIIKLATHTGMRRGELLALQWDQVNLLAKTITVKKSKSGKVRHVPLNDISYGVLHQIPGAHRTGPVFKFRGKEMTCIDSWFRGAIEKSGIAPCRFHDLRHTFATRLVVVGVDLPTIKELLGHANIATTMIYAHPSPAHRRAAVYRLQIHGPASVAKKK